MKPLIGISSGIKCAERVGNSPFIPNEIHYLNDAYVTAVERAGGLPVILPSVEDTSLLPELVSRLDGLVISGGPDVDPALFGERIITGVGPVDVRRDAAEAVVLKYVLKETQLPVLGICRGLQMMNIVEGGTLIQDLKSAGACEHRLNMFPRGYASHEVEVEEGTRLSRILGSLSCGTNSFHHQAVKAVAPGWRVSAHAKADGVIEAMEKEGPRFLLAVQWHPEGMVSDQAQQGLFRALVEAAKGRLQ